MEGEGRQDMELQPYRRDEAVAYARHWAYGRNPEFYDYERIGGDCTNFASQCIYAGTGVMNYTPIFGWYYIDANNKAPAWTGVEYLPPVVIATDGSGQPSGIQVAAHSYDAYCRPLDSYTYQQYRVLHILGYYR